MKELLKINEFDITASLYPWILLPVFLKDKLAIGIPILALISFFIWLLSGKEMIFYSSNVLIKRYQWVLRKQAQKLYQEIDYIYIHDNRTLSYRPFLTIYFKNKSKMRISFKRNLLKEIVSLISAKSIMLKSNRNDLFNK